MRKFGPSLATFASKDQQNRTSASGEPKRRNIGRRIDAHLSRARDPAAAERVNEILMKGRNIAT